MVVFSPGGHAVGFEASLTYGLWAGAALLLLLGALRGRHCSCILPWPLVYLMRGRPTPSASGTARIGLGSGAGQQDPLWIDTPPGVSGNLREFVRHPDSRELCPHICCAWEAIHTAKLASTE